MSKISLKAGEELVKNKIITEKTLQKMQASGAVSQRRMSIKRYIKTMMVKNTYVINITILVWYVIK